MTDPTHHRVVTGRLAGARSHTFTLISAALQSGDELAAADLRTSLADLRAAMSMHTGTPVADVHRDGWRLTTAEARTHFADTEATYRRGSGA